MSTEKMVTCVRCAGNGEEPGAPERPDEVALCAYCHGKKTMPRTKAIIALAKAIYEQSGSIEIGDDAKLSETPASQDGDNGCYVQAWVWVGFEGLAELDKELD